MPDGLLAMEFDLRLVKIGVLISRVEVLGIFYVSEKEGDLANQIRSASGQIGANGGAGCALC